MVDMPGECEAERSHARGNAGKSTKEPKKDKDGKSKRSLGSLRRLHRTSSPSKNKNSSKKWRIRGW